MSIIEMVESRLPPGFRFHPKDEELICDYLMKKVTSSESSLFIEVDLNKCEPWDIPGESTLHIHYLDHLHLHPHLLYFYWFCIFSCSSYIFLLLLQKIIVIRKIEQKTSGCKAFFFPFSSFFWCASLSRCCTWCPNCWKFRYFLSWSCMLKYFCFVAWKKLPLTYLCQKMRENNNERERVKEKRKKREREHISKFHPIKFFFISLISFFSFSKKKIKSFKVYIAFASSGLWITFQIIHVTPYNIAINYDDPSNNLALLRFFFLFIVGFQLLKFLNYKKRNLFVYDMHKNAALTMFVFIVK